MATALLSLPDLSQEILEVILSYLSVPDLNSTMVTCRYLLRSGKAFKKTKKFKQAFTKYLYHTWHRSTAIESCRKLNHVHVQHIKRMLDCLEDDDVIVLLMDASDDYGLRRHRRGKLYILNKTNPEDWVIGSQH